MYGETVSFVISREFEVLLLVDVGYWLMQVPLDGVVSAFRDSLLMASLLPSGVKGVAHGVKACEILMLNMSFVLAIRGRGWC